MKIHFVSSQSTIAKSAKSKLANKYGDFPLENSDVVVALGGDGLMIDTLHKVLDLSIPVFGMNRGSVGFLMNDYHLDNLEDRISMSKQSIIKPLITTVRNNNGEVFKTTSINEISLMRKSAQAAKIGIFVDGVERLQQLTCDGIIVSTPAGSTAYNLSAHGPILPLNSTLLAMTPIAAFRPRRWTGAILPDKSKVRFEIHESEKRPVNLSSDNVETQNVSVVEVKMDRNKKLVLLHDEENTLQEKIIREQFVI